MNMKLKSYEPYVTYSYFLTPFEEAFWLKVATDRLNSFSTALSTPNPESVISNAFEIADAAVLELIKRR